MRKGSRSTPGLYATGLFFGLASPAFAGSFTCSAPGDLQSAIFAAGGIPLTVSGTCTGGPFIISNPLAVMQAAPEGATINAQIEVFVPNVTIEGFTIDGMGLSPGTAGVIVLPGASLTLSGVTVQNFPGAGIEVALNASVSMSSGSITGNANSGVNVLSGGSASLGSVLNFAPNGVLNAGYASVHVSITSNSGDGITADTGATVVFSGGSITDNGGNGIHAKYGSSLSIGKNVGNGDGSTTTVSANTGIGIQLEQATLKADGITLSGNTGAPALQVLGGTANITSGTVSMGASTGAAAMLIDHGFVVLKNSNVTGPGNAATIATATGSSLILEQDSITANDPSDPTLLVTDGAALESLGTNTIENTATSGNINVITIANASTFKEVFGGLNLFNQGADTISGNGTVQMQSNIELGTGASTPSTWSGTISVQQNSTFRMDGGMNIAGGVNLLQGSNGFFNNANGGLNVVSGGVSCPFTNNSASHVAAPQKVILSAGGNTSAVTIGYASPDCLGF
jgi:hypothetical protein